MGCPTLRLRAALTLLAPAAGLAPGGSVGASPLSANGDHAFEVHAADVYRGERLDGISLLAADLSGADLRGTRLVGGLRVWSDFRRSDARNADFRNASLLGADLSRLRNAHKADFTGALFDDATRLPPGMQDAGLRHLEPLYVPEPGDDALLLAGLLGLVACARRRRAMDAALG